MRPKSFFSSLSVVTLVLLVITVFMTYKAYAYRNLYLYHPQTRVQQHNSVVTKYAEFDPNRSAAYECIPQKLTAAGVGMICSSPDRTITISCTATPGGIVEYFC